MSNLYRLKKRNRNLFKGFKKFFKKKNKIFLSKKHRLIFLNYFIKQILLSQKFYYQKFYYQKFYYQKFFFFNDFQIIPTAPRNFLNFDDNFEFLFSKNLILINDLNKHKNEIFSVKNKIINLEHFKKSFFSFNIFYFFFYQKKIIKNIFFLLFFLKF